MEIPYNDFLTVCNAMMQLNKHETMVFRFLSDTDIFRGNFTDLAKQLIYVGSTRPRYDLHYV